MRAPSSKALRIPAEVTAVEGVVACERIDDGGTWAEMMDGRDASGLNLLDPFENQESTMLSIANLSVLSAW